MGVEPVSDEALPPVETVSRARELLDQGRPFSAHEVLEARWKAAPDHERDLWQGLAQLCVALTHAERGNRAGAERLLERATDHLNTHLARDLDAEPYGVDVRASIACARDRIAAPPADHD